MKHIEKTDDKDSQNATQWPNLLEMKNMTPLFDLLNQELSIDYWYDVERFRVAERLNELGESEWTFLLDNWSMLSSHGMIHLVEACNVLDSDQCFPLFEVMLKVEDPMVGASICSALVELGYNSNLGTSILPDLQRHWANATGYERDQIDLLMGRISA